MIDVPAKLLKQMYYWEKLDVIGPAYFAKMDQLEDVKVRRFAIYEIPHD